MLSTALIASSFASKTRTVPDARVPIVKFTTATSYGAFDADVSLNTDNGTRGAAVMQELLKAEWSERARALLFAVKLFLVGRGMMDVKQGGLGGMSLFCMVVSYFQVSKSGERRR